VTTTAGRGTLSVAVIWHRLGPYHMARLRGAASLGGRVVGVEMSGQDQRYAWDKVEGAEGFERITLFNDCDCDTLPPRQVADTVAGALGDLRPDVVFCPGWGTNYALAALNWSLRTHTPSVVMTESAEGDRKRSAAMELIKRGVVRNFVAALVGGRRHVEYVCKLGMPRERVFLGYDVVDNAHFAQGSAQSRRDAELERERLKVPARYFVVVARFIPKKNLLLLLQAFSRFRATGGAGDWHLVIVGDGPMRDGLMRLSHQLDLDQFVHLPGFRQYDELPAYYGLAEAFILPSTEEQWGLVANEAMAAGLPVLISNRCGCVPELVAEGRNGFAFDPTDAGALAAVMARVAGNPQDRMAMGIASREIIANWTSETFGRGLWQAAEAAISAPRPRHSLSSRALLPRLMRRRNNLQD
jgi:1,2-diacylglycerol 3-alpha-glucosyltransferase